MDTLITDRTQADVDRARYLNNLWDPRALQWRGTPQERAEWEAGPRGAYGYADMNRVTQAAAYLIGALEELGYSVDIQDVTPAYNIRVSVDPAGGGVASGAGAYYEGDIATVTARPGEKYDFAGWREGGQTVSESASYSFAVTGPRNLTAAFALKKFQVIASVDPAGSGEVTGAGTYDIDTEVTVAATAWDGYVFTRWTENGQTVSDGQQYTFTLTDNRTLSAVMTKTYVISVTASDTDGGTVSGGGTYLDGQTVTVAAVAGDGYEFAGWSENGATVSTEAVYSFTAAADRELVAVFAKTYVITLLVDPAGSGTTAGGGTVLDGAQVTVTATPGNGYRFVAWKEDGEQVSTWASYTFTVTGDRTLTAVFEQIPVYTITATIDPPEAGTVTGAGQYQEGATVTLVAAPADGYKFSGWQEGGQTVSTDNPYTFTAEGNRNLTAACKVFSVEFTAIQTPYVNGGGAAFGNGTFVTVGNQQYYINTSKDVVNWNSNSVSSNFAAYHLAYGNGKFLMVGMSGSGTKRQACAYSTTGTSWTLRAGIAANSTASLNCLSFCNGKFFAAYSGNQYYYTTDGITWTLKSTLPGGTSYWYSFAYGNGIYVAAGSSITAAYSTNGDSWTASTLPSIGTWRSVAYGNGMFVAVNGSSTSSYAKAAKSTDGKTWTAITLPANVPCWNVIFANGKFFVVSYSTAQVFYSSDGENWKTATIPGGYASGWCDLAYGDGKLLVTRIGYKNAAYAEI